MMVVEEWRDLAERARWLLDVQHRIQRIHDSRGQGGACLGCALLADMDDAADGSPQAGLLVRVRDLLVAQHWHGFLHDLHGVGWSCSGCALLADLEIALGSGSSTVSR